MVASSYNSGDIGAVAPFLATTLGENYVYYISRATTNFHAQSPAHRAKVTPNGFITNAPHPRVRRALASVTTRRRWGYFRHVYRG